MFSRQKKKKEKAGWSTRSENSNVDSCHLIKNNECSGGFNLMSSPSFVQSQQATRREEWAKIHSLSAAPASTCNLPTTIYQLIWQANNLKRQLEMLLLACWASLREGHSTWWMTALCLSHLAAFPSLSWHTVMHSHNSLMANDANMKCKVSLIWPLLNS